VSNVIRKRSVTKHSFTTFNPAAASFLFQAGAKIKVLYEHDNVPCIQVSLKGRRQLRLLASEDYLNVTAQFNVLGELVEPRVRPPIYTVKKGGHFALLRDVGTESDYYALSRDPALLGKTEEAAEVVELTSWQDLKTFIDDVKLMQHNQLRIFVGYGPGSEVPYREIHNTQMVDRVIDANLAPPVSEAQNG
jgi:hypothetical protein